jgi:ectoine hydroxylase-related dioxygenase (phytanoyl-CoA dioxygenase family)
VVLDDIGLPESLLETVVRELASEYTTSGRVQHEGVVYQPTRIIDAWRFNVNVHAIARSKKVLALLRELYGREPLPFQTLNFRVGTEQSVHSDALHFNSMPPGYMCGVWVALEDIDLGNGPLIYYPGSHKLPEVTMQELGAEPSYDDYPKYERHIAELIEREGLEPEYGTIRKGQALLWASNLLHGGAPQRDRNRHSQVTHYFFEGCKYYTPMRSTETEPHWRDPNWVA